MSSGYELKYGAAGVDNETRRYFTAEYLNDALTRFAALVNYYDNDVRVTAAYVHLRAWPEQSRNGLHLGWTKTSDERPTLHGSPTMEDAMKDERLTNVAVSRQGAITSLQGCRSHFELRWRARGSDLKFPDDVEGFMTSRGRFVTRQEAVPVGVAAGQLHNRWLESTRPVLSSDINW